MITVTPLLTHWSYWSISLLKTSITISSIIGDCHIVEDFRAYDWFCLYIYVANKTRHTAIISCCSYTSHIYCHHLLKYHDDVIKWKHFPRNWPFVRGIHRSPVNSTHKGQWRGALMFPFICARINGWVNNGEAGDLRRYRVHCDVIIILLNLTLLSQHHRPPVDGLIHRDLKKWSPFCRRDIQMDILQWKYVFSD